jgi:IS605 OrfB family transposase
LKQDSNHGARKRIIEQYPHSLIGLETLTDIRERTKRRTGKNASKKQRRANAASSKWTFAELHAMIAYKALLNQSMAIKVDANYTSQSCPMCGHTCKGNRPYCSSARTVSIRSMPIWSVPGISPCERS